MIFYTVKTHANHLYLQNKFDRFNWRGFRSGLLVLISAVRSPFPPLKIKKLDIKSYFLNGIQLKRVSLIKELGIYYFYSTFSSSYHIHVIVGRVLKVFSILILPSFSNWSIVSDLCLVQPVLQYRDVVRTIRINYVLSVSSVYCYPMPLRLPSAYYYDYPNNYHASRMYFLVKTILTLGFFALFSITY